MEEKLDIPEKLETPQAPCTCKPCSQCKFALLAVVGILVTASLVFAGMQIGKKQTQVSPQPSPLAVVSPTPDLTANWKTYTSKVLGFEFKYPDDPKWNVKEGIGLAIYNYNVDKAPGRMYNPAIDGDLFKIEIAVEQSDLSADRWFEEQKRAISPMTDEPYEYSNIRPTVVDSQAGIYYEVKDITDSWLGNVVFESPDKRLVHFRSGLNFEGNRQIFNQILSTFKFSE